MADQTVTGKLVVTDKIGIGIGEPIAQLHLSSADPSRVFLESGGSLLKVSVDGTNAAIGTDAGTGVPLSLQTDGTNRLTITSSGNTSISGPLSVQNTLTINGHVGIGTAVSPTAKLQVNGIVAATSFQGDASGLTGLQIPAGSITNIELEDNAVTAAKIQDGSVGQAELAVNSVVEAKLATNAVTELKLANNAVSSLKLAAGSVLTDKLADSAVTTAKLAAGSVTLDKLDAAAKPAGSQWVSGSAGAIAYTSGNVGIDTATPGAPLHVGSYMVVGPFAATTGTGGIDVTGPAAELGFVKRSLTAWPASPVAGDRYVWYNQSGSASLWTEQRGDLLTVNSEGNVGIGTSNPDRRLIVRGGETSLQQEGWQTPTLQNGWVNYGNTFNNAAYFKDSLGIVHLRGLVRGGSGTIFTLPEGYRPSGRELHGVSTDPNVAGRIDILTDGQVYKESGSSNWISLDGITFMARGPRLVSPRPPFVFEDRLPNFRPIVNP